MGTNDLPEAIEVYEEALTLDPSSARLKQELQKTKAAWKKERERHVRALSRAFRVDGGKLNGSEIVGKTGTQSRTIGSRLRDIVSVWFI